jgi:hypothetical protein
MIGYLIFAAMGFYLGMVVMALIVALKRRHHNSAMGIVKD